MTDPWLSQPFSKTVMDTVLFWWTNSGLHTPPICTLKTELKALHKHKANCDCTEI